VNTYAYKGNTSVRWAPYYRLLNAEQLTLGLKLFIPGEILLASPLLIRVN